MWSRGWIISRVESNIFPDWDFDVGVESPKVIFFLVFPMESESKVQKYIFPSFPDWDLMSESKVQFPDVGVESPISRLGFIVGVESPISRLGFDVGVESPMSRFSKYIGQFLRSGPKVVRFADEELLTLR